MKKNLLGALLVGLLLGVFIARLDVFSKNESNENSESKKDNTSIVNEKNCNYDGELNEGAIFEDGQYRYKYITKLSLETHKNIDVDGWYMSLIDWESRDKIDTKMCTTINNKPIVSMAYLFLRSKAKEIDLSSFNTSNVIDMRGMFYDCSNLTSLDVSSFDTSKVKTMQTMFAGLKLDNLDLSGFDTSGVYDMGEMFMESNIDNLNLSSFSNENVEIMYGMFKNFSTSDIDLSNFNTTKVEDMTEMFMASNIDNLDLSNFNTSSVNYMNKMFMESNIENLNLSSFDTSHVTGMSEMFANSNIKNLDLSNFDTSNVTNMEKMFYKMSGTSKLDLSNFDFSKLNSSGKEYIFCDSSMNNVMFSSQSDIDLLGENCNSEKHINCTHSTKCSVK